MYQSELINELATALSAAQGEFPVLEKKSKAYNYNYADLAETLQATQDPLRKNGLAIIHQIITAEGNDILVTKLLHASGQWVSTEMPLIHKADGKINPMQALGSAITYAKRYSIGCLLNLAADKEIDDDGVKAAPKNYETHKVKETVKLPTLTKEQQEVVEEYLEEFPEAKKDLLNRFQVTEVKYIPYDKFDFVVTVFEKKKKAKIVAIDE